MSNTGVRIGLNSKGELHIVYSRERGALNATSAWNIDGLYNTSLHVELKQEEVRAVLETLTELLKEKKGG